MNPELTNSARPASKLIPGTLLLLLPVPWVGGLPRLLSMRARDLNCSHQASTAKFNSPSPLPALLFYLGNFYIQLNLTNRAQYQFEHVCLRENMPTVMATAKTAPPLNNTEVMQESTPTHTHSCPKSFLFFFVIHLSQLSWLQTDPVDRHSCHGCVIKLKLWYELFILFFSPAKAVLKT